MLQSKAFNDDSKLQLCLVGDRSHILLNAVGDHVVKIQRALILVDGCPSTPGNCGTSVMGVH